MFFWQHRLNEGKKITFISLLHRTVYHLKIFKKTEWSFRSWLTFSYISSMISGTIVSFSWLLFSIITISVVTASKSPKAQLSSAICWRITSVVSFLRSVAGNSICFWSSILWLAIVPEPTSDCFFFFSSVSDCSAIKRQRLLAMLFFVELRQN